MNSQFTKRIKKASNITMLLLMMSLCTFVSCKKDKVKPSEVNNIAIKIAPTKLNYYSGDALDLSGLVVTIHWNNGNTEDIGLSEFESKGISIAPANGTILNESTSVTITHTASTKSVSQPIIVAELLVTSISVKTPPTKSDYYVGEVLDLSGLVVTLIMNNGSTKDVAFSDFTSNNISCSPENGIQTNSSTTSVTITHTLSGKFTDYIIIDKFKDARDGQIYKFVKIGNQVWMAENLNYYTTSGSWYYNNDSATYSKPYGRLYLWATVMNGESSSDAVPSGVKGICPNGWHFPSSGEFQILADYLAAHGLTGDDLKESGGQHWGEYSTGTNSTGFSAVGSGTMYDNGTQSVYINTFADFITSSYNSGIDGWGLGNGNYFETDKLGTGNAWCVRCIQDQEK